MWKSFHECCPSCLGHTVIYTGERDKLTKGDMAFCRSCNCQGYVDVDYWGLYIDWPRDMCALCHRRLQARVRKSIALMCHQMDMRIAVDVLDHIQGED